MSCKIYTSSNCIHFFISSGNSALGSILRGQMDSGAFSIGFTLGYARSKARSHSFFTQYKDDSLFHISYNCRLIISIGNSETNVCASVCLFLFNRFRQLTLFGVDKPFDIDTLSP